MRALYSEGVRLLTACQLAQSPWQGGGVRVPAQLPPPVWSLEESPGSCGEGLLSGQGLQCVNVCIVCWVCIMREIKGQLQPERRGSQGGAGSKLVHGTFRFLPEQGVVPQRQSDWGGPSLGAAASKSQWESAWPSLSPSVCLSVHLHPKLVSPSL